MRHVQTKLEKVERFENIKGAFRVKEPIKIIDKNILLIDDVFTTGATLSEAASTLKNAGAKRVLAFSLARAN